MTDTESFTKYKMDRLRLHITQLQEQDTKTTEKLIRKLTDTEKEFIDSFAAEEFMDLQALRHMALYLSKRLARFDAGEYTNAPNGPVILEPQEFLSSLAENLTKKILSAARRTSFSSSPASNQMENYEISRAVQVVELFDW